MYLRIQHTAIYFCKFAYCFSSMMLLYYCRANLLLITIYIDILHNLGGACTNTVHTLIISRRRHCLFLPIPISTCNIIKKERGILILLLPTTHWSEDKSLSCEPVTFFFKGGIVLVIFGGYVFPKYQ